MGHRHQEKPFVIAVCAKIWLWINMIKCRQTMTIFQQRWEF